MGYEMVRRMSAAVKDLDTTRPVTAAQSNSMLNAVNASQAADVAGFNYRPGDYDAYHAQVSRQADLLLRRHLRRDDPRRISPPIAKRQFSIPTMISSPARGASRIAIRGRISTRARSSPGTMVWTGFDYRGEPQPLPWPAAGSSFGCMDLCGFPKTAYYIHQAQWIKDQPDPPHRPTLELGGQRRQTDQGDGRYQRRKRCAIAQWKIARRKSRRQV